MGSEYHWNDENRLDRVQGPGGLDVSYTYDTSGRMMTRTSGGVTTRFTWDGFDCVRETTGSSVTIYHIPDGMLQSFSLDGDVYQVHMCALGSVRMITDASGAVVARIEYGAFGEEIFASAVPALTNFPYRFVGGLGVRTDAETGLVYMRARHYDSDLGRFISRDPIGLSGGANLYSYVGNSPMKFVDPSGKAVRDRQIITGLGMLGGLSLYGATRNAVIGAEEGATVGGPWGAVVGFALGLGISLALGAAAAAAEDIIVDGPEPDERDLPWTKPNRREPMPRNPPRPPRGGGYQCTADCFCEKTECVNGQPVVITEGGDIGTGTDRFKRVAKQAALDRARENCFKKGEGWGLGGDHDTGHCGIIECHPIAVLPPIVVVE